MNALDPLVWSILLMVVGCVMLAMEVFVPSGGVLGAMSGAAFVASILIAFQEGARTGFIFVSTAVVAVPAVLVLAFKYWPKTPFGKAFIGELPTEDEVLPDNTRRELVGRVGVARSKMLPSGAVEIEGQIVDAVSKGQAIEPGTYVTVIEVRANRVVVRAAKEDERPGQQVPPEDLLNRPIEELGIESFDDPLA